MEWIRNIKPILLSRWTVMRALRVIGGGWFVVYGILHHDWLYGIAGTYFFTMGLLNMSCGACRNGACEVQQEP
ncbi:MAG TPA: hypothetical protein VFX43_10795 [Chitinophagaceae bacterium]|nr:hypothetical protein [Chitinophagaceae bacterium]